MLKTATLLTAAGLLLASLAARAQFVAAPLVTPASGNQPIPLRLTGITPGAGAVYYNGTGQLTVRRVYPLATTLATFATNSGSFAAVADVDADGQDDVLVADPSSIGSTGSLVQVYYQQAGVFTLGTTINLGTTYYPAAMVVTDLNADGRPDVVISNSNTPSTPTTLNQLAVAAGTTGRNLAAPVFIGRSRSAGALAVRQLLVADFNVDGKPDVAALYTYPNGSTTVVAGLGVSPGTGSTTTLGTEQLVSLTGTALGSVTQPAVAVADFNKDGRPDLAFADSNGPSTSNIFSLYTALGSAAAGTNLFASASILASYSSGNISYSLNGLAAADFDNDTNPDVAINLGSRLFVTRLVGNRAVSQYANITGPFTGSPAPLDLDGNAYPDILVAQIGSLVPLLNGGPLAARAAAVPVAPLYPNPSAGTFSLSEAGQGVQVRDALGRAVPATLVPGGQVRLPAAAPGVYFVEWIAASDGQPRRTKALVQ